MFHIFPETFIEVWMFDILRFHAKMLEEFFSVRDSFDGKLKNKEESDQGH